MNDKDLIHAIYIRHYGDLRHKKRGVKPGTIRGLYKSHKKKQSLAEKRKKDRIRQRRHRKKQKMLTEQQKRHGNLNEGGVVSTYFKR